ncbi:MAG: hypothetical protein K2W96_19155 [Gemmataceae bacterium]|nr:hypothetical protein [Gemmataceae bacterium]
MAETPPAQSSPLLRAVLAWSLYAIAVLSCVRPVGSPEMEPDMWWHLAVGRWVWDNGAVVSIDPFSYPDTPWVAYSWLFEVLLYGLHSALGLGGIIAYRAVMGLLIVAAIHGLCKRLQPNTLAPTALAGAALVALAPLFSERPWLFTILFAALTLRAVIELRDPAPLSPLVWLLPLAYVLWANIHIQFVHGLFLLGLACLAPLLDRFLERPADATAATWMTPRWKSLVLLTILCGLATLANPYHARLYAVVVEYATQPWPMQNVAELKAMEFRSVSEWMALGFLMAACVALGSRKASALEWLLLVATAWFAFRSRRDIWYLLLASLLVLCRVPWGEKPEEEKRSPLLALAGAVGLALLAALLYYGRDLSQPALEERVAKVFPAGAVRHVEEKEWQGPLFNDFNWGGYLIWSLPRLRVVMDGRTNLHGDKKLIRIGNVWAGLPPLPETEHRPAFAGWHDDPDLSAAGVVVASRESALASLLLTDERFTRTYADGIAWVFVRLRGDKVTR